MSQNMQDAQPQSWFARHKALVIGVVVVVAIIIAAVAGPYIVRNEGERHEQLLVGQYNNSTTALSTCLDQSQAAMQVGDEHSRQVREILTEVTSARYEEIDGTRPALGRGQMFSMIQEAYPDIDMTVWNKVYDTVIGCRDTFQNAQDRLQGTAVRYNQWRVSDSPLDSWIKDEFPSEELKITTPDGQKLDGQEAYDQITRVVLVKDAKTAFQDGEMPTQDLTGARGDDSDS